MSRGEGAGTDKYVECDPWLTALYKELGFARVGVPDWIIELKEEIEKGLPEIRRRRWEKVVIANVRLGRSYDYTRELLMIDALRGTTLWPRSLDADDATDWADWLVHYLESENRREEKAA